MKNTFFLFLFFVGFAFSAQAQAPYYDDLLIYFADGDYEKLVDKAQKYKDGDDTKNDALPYLYASKAYYEMFFFHNSRASYDRKSTRDQIPFILKKLIPEISEKENEIAVDYRACAVVSASRAC
jgi:hypothetical protein